MTGVEICVTAIGFCLLVAYIILIHMDGDD